MLGRRPCQPPPRTRSTVAPYPSCEAARQLGASNYTPCPLSRTVIFGSASLPDPDVEALARQGVNIEVVPDAGHLMPWENPGGLAAAIKRGLSL